MKIGKLHTIKILFFFVFLQLGSLLLIMLLSLFGNQQIPKHVMILLSSIFNFLVLISLFGLYKKEHLSRLTTNKISLKILFAFIPLSLLMRVLLIVMLVPGLILVSPDNIQKVMNFQQNLVTSTNTIESFTLIVSIAFLAPITEELFFRGVVFNTLLKTLTPVRASIIVSIIFSLSHGYFLLMLTGFIPSLFFTYVYYRFKNIVYPIVLHSCFNLLPLLLPLIS